MAALLRSSLVVIGKLTFGLVRSIFVEPFDAAHVVAIRGDKSPACFNIAPPV